MLLRLNLRRLRLRGHNIKKLSADRQRTTRGVAGEAGLSSELILVIASLVTLMRNAGFKDPATFNVPWLGRIADLPRVIANEVIDEVFITLPIKSQYSRIESAITILEEQGIMVHLFSDLFPHKLARSRAWEFEGAPLVSLHSAPSISWRTEAKRVIDFVGP